MLKIRCPFCDKELIPLEPYQKKKINFWCDDCDVDIEITKNKKEDK